MESKEYIVWKIEGEYATLRRTDDGSNLELFVALHLLPPGVDVGTRLRWEMMEYSIVE